MPLISMQAVRVEKAGIAICGVPALTIDAGETVAIVGSNGSGKTTLLRVLAGLEQDFRGEVQVATAREDRVFVHQTPFLFRGSVLDNVTYGLRVRGHAKSECRRRGLEWLARCQADQLADKTAANLSGGERKRVALARALVIEPKLLLLDEPWEEVDPDGVARICQVLEEFANPATLIVSSPTPPPDKLSARIVECRRPRPASV